MAQTPSIHQPAECLQWRPRLPQAGTDTPSAKLRTVLERVRHREAGGEAGQGAWRPELAQALADTIASLERWERTDSDLRRDAGPAPRKTPALSCQEHARQEAVDVEAAALARQCFRLLMAMLRAAATMSPATYDDTMVERDLPEIIELANTIATKRPAKQPDYV